MAKNNNAASKPKPFLKWAGGKSQLLQEIIKRLPRELNKNYKYFEPFVGGGAVFFRLNKIFKFEYAYLSDINPDLILTYNVIKEEPDLLISKLKKFERCYKSLDVDNKQLFQDTRDLFNKSKKLKPFEVSDENILRAAQMIFLNKTCFNGLYRVNKKGEFNVPFANPKNPLICDKTNIKGVSESLKNVELNLADYSKSYDLIDNNSFVYLDPPYKPIDGKKSFSGYTKSGFDDEDQKKLAKFCKDISNPDIDAKFLLSNSKPKDGTFERWYSKFEIDSVPAKRFINSKGNKRGPVCELLIYNYDWPLKKICTFI